MRTSNSAPFGGTLILWMCAVALLTACGGASYAKSAYEPRAQEQYAGGEAVTAAEAPGDADEGYDAMEEDSPGPPPTSPPAMPAPAMDTSTKMAQLAQPAREKAPDAAPPAGTPHGTKPTEPALASDAVPIQQVLIYTAQLRMAVFEVDKALNDVEALARSLGGFLSHRTDTQITIRVPAAQFDDALKGISSKGDVLTRNVEVEDVTEEFLDVMLRLKNARQVRDRIAQLLANAKNVEESLEVERELNRLSGEIERLEGRLKYLQNRARYSTITVTFQPEQVDEVPNSAFQLPFPWLRELGLGRLMNLR